MVKLLITLISISLLFGCAGFKAKKIVEVKVPVLYCPAPVEIDKPKYDTTFLVPSDKGDYEKIAKSYVLTFIKMDKYIETLELQLEAYKGLNDGTTNK